MNMKTVKEKFMAVLIRVKSAYGNLSPRQAKIAGILTTAPIIAVATMGGVCAGGCPYGLTHDPYPGQCPRYIDANGSGSCDLAIVAASTTTATSSSSSSSSSVSSQASVNNNAGVDNTANNFTDYDVGANAAAIHDSSSGGLTGSSAQDGSNFHVLPATLIIIGAYIFTYYLFKKGILNANQHKRIWNGLLTFGFLGMGITGVVLTVMINLGISTVYNSGITYWHAELGLLMVLATLIHFHIYRRPFKRMFKVLFRYNSSKKDMNVMKTHGTSK